MEISHKLKALHTQSPSVMLKHPKTSRPYINKYIYKKLSKVYEWVPAGHFVEFRLCPLIYSRRKIFLR